VVQIGVLTSDERLLETLAPSGLQAARIDATDLAGYERSADAPQVLVVDMRRRDQLPAGLAAFLKQHQGAGAVLVMSSLDPKVMLEAMRAGVSECVTEPLAPAALEAAVRRVLTDAGPEPAGQVFAFVGAKGGVGTTTLAVNTAAALGRASKGSVLLVDLHVGHGDDAVFLGVEPRFSVIDALENIHRVDESYFAGVVEKTDVGIHLLASSTRALHGPVEPKRLRALLDAASRSYRTTVLDVPRADPTMLDALDGAASIVIVTSQEIGSLRNAANLSETLRRRYGTGRVKVVINRFNREAVIAQSDIEKVVGGAIEHLIPSDYRSALDALNAGRPVVLDGDGRLAAAFQRFARDLAGVVKERKERPAGVLGRLSWRRA
jgi:pilus assembly protein CpaE